MNIIFGFYGIFILLFRKLINIDSQSKRQDPDSEKK